MAPGPSARPGGRVDPQTQRIRQFARSIPATGLMAGWFFGWYTEGRVFQHLKQSEHVIRSPALSSCDGAIIIRGPENIEPNETDRLMQYLDWINKKKPIEILPFDVKAASIRSYTRGVSARFNAAINIKAEQNASSAFYLLVLRENCNYVTLLSPELLMKQERVGKRRYQYLKWDFPRALIQFIDYIPDVIPFTFHVDQLSTILSALTAQKKQGLPLSVNGIPLQTSGKSSYSMNLIAEQDTELSVIKMLHNAFRDNPECGLQLRLIDFRPLFADFWIDIEGSGRVLVELKGTTQTCMYKIVGNGFEHITYFSDKLVSMFHPARPWDFLFSYDPRSREFFALPFDRLPKDWWETRIRTKSKNLAQEWKRTPLAGFEEYRISLRGPGWFKKLRRILQIRRSPPNQYDISALYASGADLPVEDVEEVESLEDSTIDEMDDLVDDLDDSEPGEEQDPQDKEATEERQASMSLTASFQSEVLTRLMYYCASTRRGVYFYIGRTHPVADFVFVEYVWTKEEQHAYLSTRKTPIQVADLPDMTRVVLLTAAQHSYGTASAAAFSLSTPAFRTFFRQYPSIILYAISRRERNPILDEPVIFLPSEQLLPSPDWTAEKLIGIRKQHNRYTGTRNNERYKLTLRIGNAISHSIRLSEVHSKMGQILDMRSNIQIGVDPAQNYAPRPYVVKWGAVKLLHAEAIYANLNEVRSVKKVKKR